MRKLSAIATLVAVATLPIAASAQAPNNDVRCLLTMAALASNEQARATALNGVYYFAGRVSLRDPGFDYATGLRSEAEKMTRADFQREFTRCGEILRAAGANLQTAQNALRGFSPKE